MMIAGAAEPTASVGLFKAKPIASVITKNQVNPSRYVSCEYIDEPESIDDSEKTDIGEKGGSKVHKQKKKPGGQSPSICTSPVSQPHGPMLLKPGKFSTKPESSAGDRTCLGRRKSESCPIPEQHSPHCHGLLDVLGLGIEFRPKLEKLTWLGAQAPDFNRDGHWFDANWLVPEPSLIFLP